MAEGTLGQLINDNLVISPAPTPNHQSASGIIYEGISRFVRPRKLGKVFYSPIDVYLNSKNAFQPDIVFISKRRFEIIDWNKGIMGAPDLVIEVLSKGNQKYDLNEKKEIYQQAGVLEYWVVNPETKWCEGFILENGSFSSLGEANAELTIKMFELTIPF